MDVLKRNRNLIISVLVVVIYTCIALVCVLNHEIWEDEAQVWMLCKYMTLPELFKHLVNEGHPSFFYLITMPWAKLGGSIICMQLLCLFASAAAVFLIWYKSGFKTWVKFAITLSAPFLYHFPVIARSYSVIPLFVLLLALLHNKTGKHPFLYALILLCLTNTHVIMAMFTFILSLRFIYLNLYSPYKNKKKPDKKCLFAAGIFISGFIALFAQLSGTVNSNVYINFKPDDKIGALVRIIMAFIFNSLDAYYIKTHSQYFSAPMLFFLTLFSTNFILLVISLYKNSKGLFWLFALSSVFQVAIYLMTYNQLILPTRIFCLYMMLLFCQIVIFQNNDFKESGFFTKKKNVEILLGVFFAFMIFNGIKVYYADMALDYSGSKRIAQFIKLNYGSSKPVIFTDSVNRTVAVNYYLDPDINLYWVRTGKPYKYVVWSKDVIPSFEEKKWEDYFRAIRTVDKKSPLFVLTFYDAFHDKNKHFQWKDFELVYITGDSLEHFEKFRLYKYKY